MFTPSRDFKLAETGVFWDTGDCPIPKGISPLLICKNIQTALAYKGYIGKLSITAYSDMEQDTADFESSGITLLRRGDRHKRRVSIMEDFMLWAYDLHCKPFNLMIISRDILNDNVFLDCFTYWNNRNGNILLAQPESEAKALSEWLVRHGNDLGGWANDMWDWESLSSSDGETILNISWDTPLAEIGVFWDTGDCPIPKGISPRMICENIQSALANKGFVGTLSITAYSDMEQDTADFESSGITLLRTGDKKDRLRKILDEMMDWARDQNPKPFNLMLISEDSQEDLYIDTLLFWNARGGNILLAQPRILSDDLAAYGIVREFWLWESLSLGLDPISHRRLSKITYRSLLRSHIAAKKLAAKTKKLTASTSRSALAPVNNKNIQVAQSKRKTRVQSSTRK